MTTEMRCKNVLDLLRLSQKLCAQSFSLMETRGPVSGGGKQEERYEEGQYKRARANGGCLGKQGRRRTWLRCEKLRGAAYRPIRRSPNGATPHRYGWVLSLF